MNGRVRACVRIDKHGFLGKDTNCRCIRTKYSAAYLDPQGGSKWATYCAHEE
jgi:hypothetical protein